MKSVEFLVALLLLVVTYAAAYRAAAGYRDSAAGALEEFNGTLQGRMASSLVANLQAYGEPFEYADFGRLDPSRVEGASYEPALGIYTYQTYRRW